MVKIRLTRVGRKHSPFYRIVVADSRKARDGKFIEIIGHYHPMVQEDPNYKVDVDRALHWLSVGAQPTDTARSLLRKTGVLKQFHETKVAAKAARKQEGTAAG